jgi:hypothetical protein
MNLKNLESKASDKINRQEAATVIKGQNLAKANDEEAPRFYLLKLELEENVEVLLSGSKPLIPLQASLIKAFDDLIKIRIKPSKWTAKQFWQWAKEFENGFLDFTSGAKGDFLERIKAKKPWGIDYKRRPQIVEVKKATNPKAKTENIFYNVVLLYPDRTENECFPFTGNYEEIANLIINWWNQKSGKTGNSQSDRNNDVKMLSKHPKVYLYFEEERSTSGARPKEGEISFRLMNKTDETISIADLKKLSNKVKEVFGNRPGYIWEKGKRYANYNHWELGYKLQLLSPSPAEGERVIRDILKIQGHEFDKARMTYSQNQAEAKAFPSKSGKKRILGEETDLPTRRPNCKVRFRYACVELGTLKHKIILFSLDGNNPIDFRLRS